MNERRRPWLICGALLVLAATTGAIATYLWWLPCQGRMLAGTPLGPSVGDDRLGRSCIDRMGEGTPFPLTTPAALSAPWLLVLATATMMLVAVAWLVPLLSERISPVRRVVAALPAVAVLVVAALGIGIALQVPGTVALAYPLATFVNLLVVSAVVVLWGHVQVRGRYGVAALALSSMGFAGPVAEYLVMVRWSELSWDAPPGSGYLTSALLLACGLTVLIMTARVSPRGRFRPSVPTRSVEVGA